MSLQQIFAFVMAIACGEWTEELGELAVLLAIAAERKRRLRLVWERVLGRLVLDSPGGKLLEFKTRIHHLGIHCYSLERVVSVLWFGEVSCVRFSLVK